MRLLRRRARSWSVRVADDLARAHVSARAALSGATGPPSAGPTPRARCASDDLLPERALAGDGHARRHLVDEVYLPLAGQRPRDTLIETLTAYFQHGQSIEATARALFVHPNTVRYRLRQVADADRAVAPPTPREALHPADRARARAGQSGRRRASPERRADRLCRNPTKNRRASFVRAGRASRTARPGKAGAVLVIVAPGQGAQTPGFLTPWLEDPTFASRFDWLSTVAGLDLAHYGTEADAETIRDTEIAQPLLVATGLVAALELFPHPADAFGQIGAVAGHSVGELDRRRRRPGDHRRAGDGAGPRARQGDGRGRRRHRRPA